MVKKLLLYLILFLTSLFADTKSDGLSILNEIRSKVGLNTLSQNNILETAAQNHADYIVDILTIYNNKPFVGHYEPYQSSYFTGYDPWDRGFYAGYNTSAYYLENLSSGQSDINTSIDALMSAIYHRFGFLNNNIDEIGIGIFGSSFVYNYNMGNSLLNTLCSGISFDGFGTYYSNVCKDETFKIQADTYTAKLNEISSINPRYTVWPINNEYNFTPVFFEESPDPLPDYSVSGNPISIEFNDHFYSAINSYSFKLYNNQSNEITNIRVLDNSNDVNSHLSAFQFALFPLERLDFNSSYSVEFTYTATLENNLTESDTISWQFRTAKPKYPLITITENNQTINIKTNTKYAIYFPPKNANDRIKRYSTSYSYFGDVPNINASFSNDQNVLYLEVNATSSDKLAITKISDYTSDVVVNLQISDSDDAIYFDNNVLIENDFQRELLNNQDRGWHLLGAVRDINTSELNNFDIVWKYVDNEWEAYSYTLDLSGLVTTFESISQGEGFWVKAP